MSGWYSQNKPIIYKITDLELISNLINTLYTLLKNKSIDDKLKIDIKDIIQKCNNFLKCKIM